MCEEDMQRVGGRAGLPGVPPPLPPAPPPAHLLLHDAADAVLVSKVASATQDGHHRQHDNHHGASAYAACDNTTCRRDVIKRRVKGIHHRQHGNHQGTCIHTYPEALLTFDLSQAQPARCPI